jgi:hypothetical protein
MEASILELKLVGGLGNQLHVVAAGYAISSLKDLPVTFDARSIPFGSNPHRRLAVHELDLGFPISVEKSLASPIFGYINFFQRKSGLHLEKSLQEDHPDWTDNRKSPREQIASMPTHGKIEGHFLDFEWAEIAYKNGLRFNGLKKPIKKKLAAIMGEIGAQDIAIHARFGDYRKNLASFPLLGPDFYHRALETFSKGGSVWLFTDDVRSAKEILGDNFLRRVTHVSQFGLSDVESFYLLTHFRRIVTANSTYSSWAAFFAEKNCGAKIITPTPHMFGDWRDQLPKSWLRLPVKNS